MDDWDDTSEREEIDPLSDFVALHAASTPEELWRVLTMPGFRSGLHPFEAVGLFRHHLQKGEPGAVKTALRLCTCGRWEPYTGRLIARLVNTGILSEKELNELVECFLWSDRYRFEYPAAGFGAHEIVVDLDDRGRAQGSVVISLDPNTPVPADRRIAPPLRRWAAASALRRDPGRFATIRARAQTLRGRDGAAIVSGLLDAFEALDADTALKAIAFGLDWPLGSVRLLALDLLAARDLVAARRRAAADPDKKVRAWTGPRARQGDPSGAAGRERGNQQETRSGSARRAGRAVSGDVSGAGSCGHSRRLADHRDGSLGPRGHRPRGSRLHRVRRGARRALPVRRRRGAVGLSPWRPGRTRIRGVQLGGWDEGDQVSGRGWAVLPEDGSLRGHIFFHFGDDSGFRAVRAARKTEATDEVNRS